MERIAMRCDRLSDPGNDETKELQREKKPGDCVQPVSIR